MLGAVGIAVHVSRIAVHIVVNIGFTVMAQTEEQQNRLDDQDDGGRDCENVKNLLDCLQRFPPLQHDTLPPIVCAPFGGAREFDRGYAVI